MISSHDQAVNHAWHADHRKHKNVVVLPDGQIYAGNDEQVQKAIDTNEVVFIVKGDLKKKPEKSKKKTDDKTE